MSVSLSSLGGAGAQFFDDNGDPLSGGKIYTYVTGTTTPLTTYTTSSGLVARSNPIVLDAAGRITDSGEIWLTDGAVYKFVLKTSTDTLIKTWDTITGISSNITAGNVTYTPGAGSLLPSPNTVAGALNSLSNNTTGSAYMGFLQSGGSAIARTVQSKLRDIVSVKDFGAVGNGSTDDTAAIQAAVNAVYNATGGGAVLFPAGTYKLTDTITINCSTNLIGESIQGTNIHLYVSTPKPAFFFDGTVNIHFGGGISNMRFDCHLGAVPGDGIRVQAKTPSAITTMAIRDLVMYGVRDGIVLQGFSAAEVYLNTIENVKVIGTNLDGSGNGSLRYGFYADTTSYNSFRNCEATNVCNGAFGFRIGGGGTLFDNITTDGVAIINCPDGTVNQWTVEIIQATTPAAPEALNVVGAASVNSLTLIDVANSKCNTGIKLFTRTALNNMRVVSVGGSTFPAYPIALDAGASGVISNCGGLRSFLIEQYTSAGIMERFTFINSPDFTNRQVGVKNVAAGAKPTAADVLRGQLVLEKGGAGVADVIYVCRKNAANTYEWQALA